MSDSPLPWVVDEYRGGTRILDAEGRPVPIFKHPNAWLIVRAVNALWERRPEVVEYTLSKRGPSDA